MAELAIIDKSVEKAHIWLKPSATPVNYRGLTDFLDRIASKAKLDGETEAFYAVSSVAQVLRRHVSQGELDDVRAILPDELRVILS